MICSLDSSAFTIVELSVSLVLLEDVERNHILSVLKSVDNNKNEAADILGIGLTTLYRKLNDYKLTDE